MNHKLNISSTLLYLNYKNSLFSCVRFPIKEIGINLHIIVPHIKNCDIITTYKINTLTIPI